MFDLITSAEIKPNTLKPLSNNKNIQSTNIQISNIINNSISETNQSNTEILEIPQITPPPLPTASLPPSSSNDENNKQFQKFKKIKNSPKIHPVTINPSVPVRNRGHSPNQQQQQQQEQQQLSARSSTQTEFGSPRSQLSTKGSIESSNQFVTPRSAKSQDTQSSTGSPVCKLYMMCVCVCFFRNSINLMKVIYINTCAHIITSIMKTYT